MSYNAFAKFYDSLTENAEYENRADYLVKILCENGVEGGILLDLACGTGTLSFLMEERGFDVIGVDISPEMLNEAMRKKSERSSDVLFLNQDMTELDLYGTVKSTVCSLDSINHIASKQDLKKTFKSVSLFTEPDGIFIFDVNTLYKHKCVLADNTFVYETENCFAVWQNEFCGDGSVNIDIDFFEACGDKYIRHNESFTEYYYSDKEIANALNKAGFETVNVYDNLTFEPANSKTQRKYFVCRKVK